MTVLTFDELNVLDYEGRRSEEYEEYFSDMGLTKKQKEDRIELAKKFEDEFWPVLILLATLREYGTLTEDEARQEFWDAFWAVINLILPDDDNREQMADDFADEVTRSTMEHLDDPYYFSKDRAMFMSENESESAHNYKEFGEALASGKTHKRWIDMRDTRVRKTHSIVGGTVMPIKEPFLVGDSLLMFPKDTSLGADASEIVNCRCIAQYF